MTKEEFNIRTQGLPQTDSLLITIAKLLFEIKELLNNPPKEE